MSARRLVVVGNGIAGLSACDALREAGYDGALTVVGAEVHQPYSRPALSKALLHPTAGLQEHALPAPTHEATELLGVAVTGLDEERGTVRLDTGDEVPYDGLVIASGSRPRRLTPQTGPDGGTAELCLRTLDDALALKARLTGTPSVVVVGGGPLGMELASGCVQAGCEVTLVTDAPPLAAQLGAHLSGLFTAAAHRAGVRILQGGPARIRATTTGTSVLLADGTVLHPDLLVSAIGDIPNVDWLAGTSLLVNGQLRVDTRGRLREHIVAAGDVAHFPTRHGVRRVPLWTSAIDQAKVAAVGLLRGAAAPELAFQPYFWTEAFGLSVKAVGYTPVAGEPSYRLAGAEPTSALLHWAQPDGSGTAAAVNYRIPIPKLRRLANQGPAAG